MYKLAAWVLTVLSVFTGITAMGISEPVISAIRGLESTLFFLASLAFFAIDDLRSKKV